MPLDTAWETNQFLYARDIKENPLPQPNTTFSAPHDEMFFAKLNKYLDSYNSSQSATEQALMEAFRQLRAHALTPLGSIFFFGETANFYSLQKFYKNEQNAKWRSELCDILVLFSKTRGSLTAIQNANSEVLDDFFQFVLGEFIEYPVLIEIADCCCENLALFKDQQQIFFDKALKFVQNWNGASLEHLLSTLVKIGRSSWENYSEALKLGRELKPIYMREERLSIHYQILKYVNFLVSFDVKSANYFKDIFKPVVEDLFRYDQLLQEEALAFVGKMVQLLPQIISEQMLGKKEGISFLVRLLDGLKKCAQSGYDDVRKACCTACTFMVDGPLRKERGLFLEILGILGEQGVEYAVFIEFQRVMHGARPQECLIEREYANVQFGK